MRAVLGTNILVSSLLAKLGNPATIYNAWLEDDFVLLTCEAQLDELRSTLRKPRLTIRIKPHETGKLMNRLRQKAEVIESLARVSRSPDPTDDFLLALSEAGSADYLVTGDKNGLLSLKHHKTTKILSATTFAGLFA
jgi:putative PIN family toxin of toxin-antitoxin system